VRRIIPSIASANPLCLERELERISTLPSLHLDIEDGNFIPNITFGMKTVGAIAGRWQGQLDAHLMVTNPEDYLDELIDLGVSAIAFHIESVDYPLILLERIRSRGCLAGIALNPATWPERLSYLAGHLDYCLVMTCEPDGRGQMFLHHMVPKIKALREMLPADKSLWVDGGIGVAEAKLVFEAGADTAIMGRAVFGADDPVNFVKQIINL